MKIFLRNDNSGGAKEETHILIGNKKYYLKGYAAKIVRHTGRAGLNYYYDICGKGIYTTPTFGNVLKTKGEI